MVPADEDGSECTRTVGHLIGIRAITNDIAQGVNLVVFGSGVQASLQRFKVGMDVRQNQYAQGAFQVLNEINGQMSVSIFMATSILGRYSRPMSRRNFQQRN